MGRRRYSRKGRDVLLDGKHYATAKDTPSAANIVLALEAAYGRQYKEPDNDA